MKLHSKTILITGGGSGIGSELAIHLANDNRVIICGRQEDKLKKTAARNSTISYYVADVSDAGQIDTLFESMAKDNVVLDVVFNNAGVVEIWNAAKSNLNSTDIFQKMNTNLAGAVAVCNRFIQQASPKRENLIVNITSELALFPIPIMPFYAATKAGLRVFTKTLRHQLKDTNFSVVEILPPAVDTDMPRSMGNTGKAISPVVFAREVIAKIERGDAEFAPGANVPLLKLFAKFLPHTGLNLIDKMSKKQLGIE